MFTPAIFQTMNQIVVLSSCDSCVPAFILSNPELPEISFHFFPSAYVHSGSYVILLGKSVPSTESTLYPLAAFQISQLFLLVFT